jgi:hypothetical protein
MHHNVMEKGDHPDKIHDSLHGLAQMDERSRRREPSSYQSHSQITRMSLPDSLARGL